MFDELRSAVATIERFVRELEPWTVDGPGAVGLVELFARAEHVSAAGKALAAKRVDETGAYRESGARSAGHWLALRTGVPVANAFRVLETVEALGELPVTNEAFRAGKLSETQAHEITAAARKDPTAEAELVDAARTTTVKGLKDRCHRVRAAAEADDAAWAQRLHDTRQLRTWVDPDSATRGIWRLAPDKGAEVNAALDAEIDLIFAEARANGGDRESREAYAADALHALITRGPRKATGASLIVDEAPVRNGYARRGERCEIPGIGQIPVTIARRMLADAKVREIPRDGALLPDHSTDKRYYPPWMTAWLDQRYPVCGQPGCDADFQLENDHVVALEDGGRTELANLWRLCKHHHRLKHDRGWKVVGEPHDWRLVPPDAAEHSGVDPP
jgi:HNH endonuclease